MADSRSDAFWVLRYGLRDGCSFCLSCERLSRSSSDLRTLAPLALITAAGVDLAQQMEFSTSSVSAIMSWQYMRIMLACMPLKTPTIWAGWLIRYFSRLNRDAPQLTSASLRSVALNLGTLREQMPAKSSQLCASSELMQKVWLKVYREVSSLNLN